MNRNWYRYTTQIWLQTSHNATTEAIEIVYIYTESNSLLNWVRRKSIIVRSKCSSLIRITVYGLGVPSQRRQMTVYGIWFHFSTDTNICKLKKLKVFHIRNYWDENDFFSFAVIAVAMFCSVSGTTGKYYTLCSARNHKFIWSVRVYWTKNKIHYISVVISLNSLDFIFSS